MLTPDAMRDEAGMLPCFSSGRAFVPHEIYRWKLPDQVEIVSLHGVQTSAIPGGSAASGEADEEHLMFDNFKRTQLAFF